MTLKNRLLILFLVLGGSLSFGQLYMYDYAQELKGISAQWHNITLPNSVFNEVSTDLSDIRIYGITETDTLEAPYILKVASGIFTPNNIDFILLNTSYNSKGYYFTYEIPSTEPINEIHLDFENPNFDWSVTLEGSNDQKEWFTLLNNYRILSIKNENTDYRFTKLDFPSSKYAYYRLHIPTAGNPKPLATQIRMNNLVDAEYRDYPITFSDIYEKNKQTVIDIDLKQRVPISSLKLNLQEKIDYYRPIAIQYVSDSTQTEKGWKYGYQNLFSGTLTSLENKKFNFSSTLAQKVRVTIENHDNRPLQIDGVEIKGFVHTLTARFTEPATYFLVYGNTEAETPYYDIVQAAAQIPGNLSALTLGEVRQIPKKAIPAIAPFFENRLWLWGVMGIVILVVGWFTLKMMRQK